MSQSETNVWRNIALAFSPRGFRLFRNQRYKGRIARGDVLTNGYADCGVGGDGGSDLIGWRTIIITPAMIGRKIAQFVAIETKTERGVKRDQQIMFVDMVNKSGGLSGFAKSNDCVDKLIEEQDKQWR